MGCFSTISNIRDNKSLFRDLEMIIEHLGKKFYIDNKLAENIRIYVKQVVTQDEDAIFVIDGPEGAGKSKLSRQISWTISYFLKLDHNIDMIPCIDDLHYNLPQYIKRARNRQKYQINILDESRAVLNRKRSMSKESVMFTNYLSECRKDNQFHILNLPAFHDLDKYIVLWRMKLFVHVQKQFDNEGNIIRGQYLVYPINHDLFYLWEEGRYRYPKPNYKKGAFQGRFNDFEPFDNMKQFYDKQAQAMDDKYDLDKESKTKEDILKINSIKSVGVKETAKIWNVSERTVYNWQNSLIKDSETES